MANYLIIAGTSSIGYTAAEKLLAAGHGVFITGREQSKTEQIAQRLKVPFATLDAADFSAVDSIFELAKTTLGSLYGVVNCAGSLLLKAAHLTSEKEYEQTILANLTTSFAVVRAAGKYFSQDGGAVVLVSSAAAMTGISNHEAIAAAKGGIISLTMSAAATYASMGVRFNAVAPGLVETHLTTPLISNPLAHKASVAMHALGRLGAPADIASAILFFLNPENSWVTGQVLGVDGGLSRIHPKIKM